MRSTRLINIAWIFSILIGLFLFAFLLMPIINSRRTPRIANTPVLLQQVKSLTQLVTVKYVLQQVVILEDVKWYGENRLLMLASGVIKAGVDLGRLEEGDIHISDKKISIRLPPAQVTDVYLDEKNTKVIERSTGLIRSFDKDLEQKGRSQALDDLKRSARHAGILKDAEERSRQQVENLFKLLGFEQVEFR